MKVDAAGSSAGRAGDPRPVAGYRSETGKGRSGWSVLGAALVVQVAVAEITQAYPTLAPYLQADLKLSMSQVGLFTSCLYIGHALGSIPAGWATDRIGDRTVLVGGALLSGLLAIAVALLSGGGLLLAVALASIGLVNSTATPAGSHAVMQSFPSHRRGLVMGIRQTGIPLGGALAAAILPPVAHSLGWRVASGVAGVLALLAAALCALLYRRPPAPHRALADGPPAAAPAPPTATRIGRHRLSRDVVLAAAAGITLPVGQFTLVTYLILYLRDRFSVSTLTGASILLLAQLAGAGGRILWSGASDWLFRRRRKPVLLAVIALAGLSALILAWLPAGTPLPLIAAVAMFFGSSAIAWQGLYITLLAELAEPGWEGRTVGFSLVFTSIGIVIGPPLFGYLVDATGNYRLGWALLAAVLAAGALLLAPVREKALHGGRT